MPDAEAEVEDVLHEVCAHALGQLGFAPRDPADRREHQARGIEDGAQGADPGQVVVARTEEAEQRVRDVRVEHLDRPVLPFEEEVRKAPDETEQGVALEQGDGRRRRSRRRLQGDDPDLPALVGAVEREQERHDERDGPKAGDRRDDDDDAGSRAGRHDVAESQRQDGARGEVQRAAEIGRHGPQLVAQGEQDQAVSGDEGDEPGPQEGDRDRGGEQPEDRVVGPGRAGGQDGPEDAPRTTNEVPADSKPARRRAGYDHRLEQIPEGERQEEHASGEYDDFHRPPIIPRPGWGRESGPCRREGGSRAGPSARRAGVRPGRRPAGGLRARWSRVSRRSRGGRLVRKRGSGVGGSFDGGGATVHVEQVANSLERPDAARLAGLRPELAPDAADPDTEVLEVVAVLGPPHLREQLRMQDDLAGVGREVLEEEPLGTRQLDELARPLDHPPLEVDLHVVEADHAGAW